MSNKDNKINWAKSPSVMLNLGHGNFVGRDRIVAIMESSSLPMKRLRDKAAQNDRLFDATAGRKTKAIIVTDSQQVFLSALSPSTLHDRLVGQDSWTSQAQLEMEDGEFAS